MDNPQAAADEPFDVPEQPIPCIGIGPFARQPFTEEHAKLAEQIKEERIGEGVGGEKPEDM